MSKQTKQETNRKNALSILKDWQAKLEKRGTLLKEKNLDSNQVSNPREQD